MGSHRPWVVLFGGEGGGLVTMCLPCIFHALFLGNMFAGLRRAKEWCSNKNLKARAREGASLLPRVSVCGRRGSRRRQKPTSNAAKRWRGRRRERQRELNPKNHRWKYRCGLTMAKQACRSSGRNKKRAFRAVTPKIACFHAPGWSGVLSNSTWHSTQQARAKGAFESRSGPPGLEHCNTTRSESSDNPGCLRTNREMLLVPWHLA